jgi:hypothetical protein
MSVVPPRVEEGWVSCSYGHRESAAVIVMEAEGRKGQRLTTVAVPVHDSMGKIEGFLKEWCLEECGVSLPEVETMEAALQGGSTAERTN